jgi:hypothetical protein
MIEQRTERREHFQHRMSYWLWLGPLLYMLVIGLYSVARYAGQWAEADSATFTQVIRPFAREGRLIPQYGQIYPNGYAYQAISTFIIALTGLDVAALQQLVFPLLASLVVLPAWALYRELTGSARGATLTTVLLFTQPEFLFVILRSSHEKFTRTLMLFCLFCLVYSFRLRNRPWLLAAFVALFYLGCFSLIASNNLLAHSFIVAVVIALVLGWLLVKRTPDMRQKNIYVLQRLLYVTLICLGLTYIFTFYIYPPGQHDLLVLRSTWDRIAALILDVETQSTNPYTQIGAAWVQPAGSVYFAVSIANWIILVTSFIIWSRQGLRWLWWGEAPKLQADRLLWLFYAAFAAQGALSVVADTSGVLSSNLQHRLFPSFAIIAVAIVGTTLGRWRPRRFDGLKQPGLIVGIFCVAILSVFKATNEPLLSNKWTFYRPAELAVLQWSDAHLQNAEIWTEFDERLVVGLQTEREESPNGNRFINSPVRPTTRNMILTSVTRLRGVRLQRPLPVPPDALLVYDNGAAELYHLRPQTPYQP